MHGTFREQPDDSEGQPVASNVKPIRTGVRAAAGGTDAQCFEPLAPASPIPPFRERRAINRRLNDNIARIESVKIKVMEWPGLASAVKNEVYADLDAVRGALVQFAYDATSDGLKREEGAPDARPGSKRKELKIDGIIGRGERIRAVLRTISKVAPTDITVLLEGETGSGKELFARIIHNNSKRKNLIAVNCGAIPAGLIESELFGHVKGAFTGATQDRQGAFAVAGGGTIFLDEIGELELPAQVKLLRVLELGEMQRVGSDKTVRTNVRVIAATNHELARMVEEGTFREDLYYRLNVCPIAIPPLRERRDEIRVLLDYFYRQFHAQGDGKRPMLSRELRDFIYHDYDFPGNIRELKNLAQYILMIDSGRPVSLDDLPERYRREARAAAERQRNVCAEESPLTSVRDLAERDWLVRLVQRNHGNIKSICGELKLSRARVYQLFQKHAIHPARFR